jgi:two-component system, OmpR family, sensor histidine kinase MtrB
VRKRLIVAFTVVALLAALASAWLTGVIVPFFPSLHGLFAAPKPLLVWLIPALHHPDGMLHPRSLAAFAFFLAPVVLLLAVITGLAFAASRRVLRPVRRLAQAAERMSGGDMSVRIEPSGRDELARLVSSFNEMASALQDKVGELQRMEARARQFAGDVSHELRTPLTAMTAVTDVLGENAGLTGDAAAAARLVREEILHLNHLVDDLIEISRFDAGTAELVTDQTDIAMAIGRCLRARGWDNVHSSAPAGLIAWLDRRRFDVIIANLVGNALRHGSPPVIVTAGLQPDAKGGQHLAVAVRDHGPGLSPAAIAHVFDRFYKANTARARSEGSGLGLAIAWENARLHGGRIEAGNHPDGGALFTVILQAGDGGTAAEVGATPDSDALLIDARPSRPRPGYPGLAYLHSRER